MVEIYKPDTNFAEVQKELIPQRLDQEFSAIQRALKELQDAQQAKTAPVESGNDPISPATVWAAEAFYKAGALVYEDFGVYRAKRDHKSADFAADLAADNWITIFDLEKVHEDLYSMAYNADVIAVGRALAPIKALAGQLDLIAKASEGLDDVGLVARNIEIVNRIAVRIDALDAVSKASGDIAQVVAALQSIKVVAANLTSLVGISEKAINAAADAQAAAEKALEGAKRQRATTVTSVEIGEGIRTAMIEPGKEFDAGQHVRVIDKADPLRWVAGLITNYQPDGCLTFIVEAYNGSGIIAESKLFISAHRGAPGQKAEMIVLATK